MVRIDDAHRRALLVERHHLGLLASGWTVTGSSPCCPASTMGWKLRGWYVDDRVATGRFDRTRRSAWHGEVRVRWRYPTALTNQLA